MATYASEIDNLTCSIEYTPCLKITVHDRELFASNIGPRRNTISPQEGRLNIQAPFVSKYCLPKDEYIVKIVPYCDLQPHSIGQHVYQTSNLFWLSLLTNFGRVIETEKNDEWWSRDYGNGVHYYDIKGKYYIHKIGFQGQRSDEHEIIPFEPLDYKMPSWFVSCLQMKTTDDWQPLLNEFNNLMVKLETLQSRNKQLQDDYNKLI
jgi:hypothetical protein